MKGWKAVAGVVLIFFLGALAGSLGVYRFHRRTLDRFLRGGPDTVSDFYVRKLSRDLELDAAQKARVEAIVRRTGEEIREVRRECRPRIEEIFEKGRREIREGLRPDQQARFDGIVAERHRRGGRWQGKTRDPGP